MYLHQWYDLLMDKQNFESKIKILLNDIKTVLFTKV